MTCCPLCRRRGSILLPGPTLHHAGFQAGAAAAFADGDTFTP